MKRGHVRASVSQDVLLEAGYKCGNPSCRHVLTLEVHHIVWVKDGGPNEPSNLLALCPNCHSLHTEGYIPAEAIHHWKGMLIALNSAFGVRTMDLLLFLHCTADKALWHSADGVLQFAGLIASGLVQITEETVRRPCRLRKAVTELLSLTAGHCSWAHG